MWSRGSERPYGVLSDTAVRWQIERTMCSRHLRPASASYRAPRHSRAVARWYGKVGHWLRVSLFFVGAVVLGGCGSLLGGLDVRGVGTSFEAPSNVAVYLSVADGEQPVTGLTPDNFAIHENGQYLDGQATRQTLLDRDLVAAHKTLLLVDVSAATDPATKRALARAIAGFVSRVRRTQAVAVHLFDGRSKTRALAEFPPVEGENKPAQSVDVMNNISPADPSRDLHGALVSGIQELDVLLTSAKKPLRIGSLVFFTGGPDLAGRVTEAEVYQALDVAPHHVFAIGMEGDEQPDLAPVARSGVVKAASTASLGIAFEEMATKVIQTANQYYLLSYCSPARAGERRLQIDVNMTTVEGDQKSGSWQADFNATGFGPGCDPQKAPRFVVATHGPAPPAPTPPAPPPSQAEAAGGAPSGETPPQVQDKPQSQPAPKPSGGDDDKVIPPPAADGYAPVE